MSSRKANTQFPSLYVLDKIYECRSHLKIYLANLLQSYFSDYDNMVLHKADHMADHIPAGMAALDSVDLGKSLVHMALAPRTALAVAADTVPALHTALAVAADIAPALHTALAVAADIVPAAPETD